MAMSTNTGNGPVADINITPLIDVMLVLLVIFMITAPLLQHDIKIDLPQPNPNQLTPPSTPINLSIKDDGSMSWNGQSISDLELQAQLAVIGTKPGDSQPEIQITAGDQTQYDYIARVLAAAKRANVQKIGFEK